MSEKELFAVAGNPVFHSRSPQIFNRLFDDQNIPARYIRLAGQSAGDVITTAEAMGIRGFNVTLPFKQDIMGLLDCLGDHARRIGAVNTVTKAEGRWKGFNTDFIGVEEALKSHDFDPKGKKAVILGAGGAARAAVYGLIRSGASNVVLINRTEEKAKKASLHLGCEYSPLEKAKEWLSRADVLISCVPSSENMIDLNDLKDGCVILNADYKAALPGQNISKKGFRVIDGLEWLYYQALPAFNLFADLSGEKKYHPGKGKKALSGEPSNKPCIALVGLMGSGKTLVGKELAVATGREFVDIDEQIEKSSGKTINQIFKEKGETGFRRIERSVIREHITRGRRAVISTGGGAVLEKQNREILRRHCHVVWLWVTASTACQRANDSTRPLLPEIHPERKMEKFLRARIPFYAGVSDLVINTEYDNTENIAGRIMNEMG